jgi:phosphosulfolactate synthase (CoM biosynthesis protein A)
MVKKGKFDPTPESMELLKEQALVASIHAQIVNSAPKAVVSVQDGVVTIGNLDGNLKSDKTFREKTAKKLVDSFHLKDVIYAAPVKAKKDHVNTFFNIDVNK